jgi:hypothetical protein
MYLQMAILLITIFSRLIIILKKGFGLSHLKLCFKINATQLINSLPMQLGALLN